MNFFFRKKKTKSDEFKPPQHTYDVISDHKDAGKMGDVDKLYSEIKTTPTTTKPGAGEFSMRECSAYKSTKFATTSSSSFSQTPSSPPFQTAHYEVVGSASHM